MANSVDQQLKLITEDARRMVQRAIRQRDWIICPNQFFDSGVRVRCDVLGVLRDIPNGFSSSEQLRPGLVLRLPTEAGTLVEHMLCAKVSSVAR